MAISTTVSDIDPIQQLKRECKRLQLQLDASRDITLNEALMLFKDLLMEGHSKDSAEKLSDAYIKYSRKIYSDD